jgi:hypothetical protein
VSAWWQLLAVGMAFAGAVDHTAWLCHPRALGRPLPSMDHNTGTADRSGPACLHLHVHMRCCVRSVLKTESFEEFVHPQDYVSSRAPPHLHPCPLQGLGVVRGWSEGVACSYRRCGRLGYIPSGAGRQGLYTCCSRNQHVLGTQLWWQAQVAMEVVVVTRQHTPEHHHPALLLCAQGMACCLHSRN